MDFQQHLQELYGISKFMLFLADQIPEDEYEQLLQLQSKYYNLRTTIGTSARVYASYLRARV